jgi:hypothetical protein
MMGTRIRAVVTGVIISLVLLNGTAIAATVPVVDLIEDGSAYGGQVITVSGELVGDYGFRSDGWMWTQLNGDSYAVTALVEGGEQDGSNIGIGVRMPVELAAGLDAPGRYRMVGPLVEATGIWRYHDPSRQGETYLEITSLTVVVPGRGLHENPDWIAIAIGGVLAIVTGVVARLYVRKRDGVT